MLDLEYLVEHISADPKMAPYKKLTASLCEVIEDFGLVRFIPLAIEDEDTVSRVAGMVDKAIGYSLGVHKGARLSADELRQREEDGEDFDLRNAIAPALPITQHASSLDIQERYFEHKEDAA